MKASLTPQAQLNISVQSSEEVIPSARATITKTVNQNVKVQNNGGILQTTTPITLKNQVNEIRSIEDIEDVEEVNVVDGSTLVYNALNDKYEVKKLEINDFDTATLRLDGGEF